MALGSRRPGGRPRDLSRDSRDKHAPGRPPLILSLSESEMTSGQCDNGRIMGLSNEVRVFDVQHIKGLEFEAVFFLGIDRLAEREELFDRFLYVGATRAATHLGMTCESDLPPRITHLKMYLALTGLI